MRQLLEDGEDVKILDIWKSKNHPNDVEFIDCDIRDRDGVRSAMKDIDIAGAISVVVLLSGAAYIYFGLGKTSKDLEDY